MTDAHDKWEEFLAPEVLQQRLISASLFITAYEVLKESIIGRIRDFFLVGFDASGLTYSDKYKNDVLARHRHPLHASLDWLREHEVISDADIATFDGIRTARNAIAHRLPALVFEGKDHDLIAHFTEATSLLRKIEIWWVMNVEIPTNPDYDGQEIDEAGIVPGPVLMMQMMLEVVAGNGEYLEEWRKLRQPQPDSRGD